MLTCHHPVSHHLLQLPCWAGAYKHSAQLQVGSNNHDTICGSGDSSTAPQTTHSSCLSHKAKTSAIRALRGKPQVREEEMSDEDELEEILDNHVKAKISEESNDNLNFDIRSDGEDILAVLTTV